MRVFVTGATGFVGSAVVQELLNAGHEVLGLARNEKNAQALREAGAQIHWGDLENLDSLRKGAAACDGVIHTGFIHDFSRFKEVCEVDRIVIRTIGEELAGSGKPFVITSGIGILGNMGRLATEDDLADPSAPNPRIASEQEAVSVSEKGIKVSVVRLPPTVHGAGDHGFIPILIGIAREKGVSVYKEEGQNRWPAVHRLDAAKVFRLALEKAPLGITRYHAVDEEGIPFREIASAIGQGLHVPVERKSAEQVADYFTWFTHFAGMDCASSSAKTRSALDWKPSQAGLIEDLAPAGYFQVQR